MKALINTNVVALAPLRELNDTPMYNAYRDRMGYRFLAVMAAKKMTTVELRAALGLTQWYFVSKCKTHKDNGTYVISTSYAQPTVAEGMNITLRVLEEEWDTRSTTPWRKTDQFGMPLPSYLL